MSRSPRQVSWNGAAAESVPPADSKVRAPEVHWLPALTLVIGAVAYNAILALAAANGVAVGEGSVIFAEFLLLLATLALVVAGGRHPGDAIPVILLAFFLAVAILTSLLAQNLYPAVARNAAIIALFFMLGLRVNSRTLRLCFGLVSGLVAAGLILELANVESYIALFEPGRYYQATRGSEPLEQIEGLYRNASGFESRFVISQILDHRASSIFLEPVSLGNFGVLILGFLACFWKGIGRLEKLSYLGLSVLILLTSNSRILLAFMLICPLVYVIGPWVSRNARLLMLPAILLCAILIYNLGTELEGDNLLGRIDKAMRNMAELNVPALLGANPALANGFSDSGYAYVVASSSVFGLIGFWLFVSMIVPDRSVLQKRAGLFLCSFVFLSLLISGTSIFSIKVAAMLWLIMGFARQARLDASPTPRGTEVVPPRPDRWAPVGFRPA